MDLLALSSSVAKPFPLRHITNELARRQSTITVATDLPVLELIGPAQDDAARALALASALSATETGDEEAGDVAATSATSVAPSGTKVAAGANVVSIGWLGSQADAAASLALLVPLLGDSGVLYFVEPSLSSGFRRQVALRMAPWAHRRSGWWPNYDMPALMREAGLVVTDIERFFIPNVGVASASWVQGRATKAAPNEPPSTERAVGAAVTGSKTSEG